MINWVASYPKSGNTWMRLLLDAYLRDDEPDLKRLFGVYSDQLTYFHGLDNGVEVNELNEDQKLLTRPMALLRMATSYTGDEVVGEKGLKYPLMIKTHQANMTISGVRLIPPQVTNKVLYVARDPRSIVASYAKHFGVSIEEAILLMVNPQHSVLGDTGPRRDLVMQQYTSSWNDHVLSYIGSRDLKVLAVRYEAMQKNTLRVLLKALKWLEIDVDEERAKRAVKACELSKMREREADEGFKECSIKADKFFGEGRTDWDLSDPQLTLIEGLCAKAMTALGYKSVINQD